MTSDKNGLSEIGQIAITVSDIRKALSFYRDTLGMKFLFEATNMAFFDCNGIRLMIGLPENEGGKKYSSVIYYKVSDIHKIYDTLHSRGVIFEAKPHFVAKLPDHDLWMAFFRDQDNNLLALMSEVRG